MAWGNTKRMSYCKKCKGKVVIHAFSFSNCKNCGVKISTPHQSSYKLCDDCAGDDKCVQCGNRLFCCGNWDELGNCKCDING